VLAISFYDVVLWVHVMAVVITFGITFTYPLWFAYLERAPASERAGLHGLQATIGKRIIGPGTLVILLAGAYLASDRDLWGEVWVVVPLIILIILGGLGGAYFGPREERLSALAKDGDETGYRRLLGQVRAVGYASSALVLVAAFFMITKLGA
jgi:hypothetical protein